MPGVQERKSRRQSIQTAALAAFEQLENRYLLSAGVNQPNNGVCLIDESADNNAVEIIVRNSAIAGDTEILDSNYLDNAPQEEAGVTSVQIEVGDGNDLIRINATTLTATTDSSSTANDISAGNGNDTIKGGPGRDVIISGNGASSIDGVSGNDTIQTGTGADTVVGGTGADDIVTAGNASVVGGTGGSNELSAPTGNATVTAGSYGDFITVESGNCYVQGGAGNDSIVGGGGNDTMFGGGGSDSIQSGNGVCEIALGNEGILQFSGSANNPVGHSYVTLGVGADTVVTSGSGDTIVDGAGANVGSKLFVDNDPTGDTFTHVVTHANGNTGSRNDTVTSDDTYNPSDITARDQFYLNIVVDGQTVDIPSDAGSYAGSDSVAEVIGYESNGDAIVKLRQSYNPTQLFYLGTFFDQWGIVLRPYQIGQYITSGGHTLSVSITHAGGGTTTVSGGVRGYEPEQGDTITITYT